MPTTQASERINEIWQAGERLLAAFAEEERFFRMRQKFPDDEQIFVDLVRARRKVEERQQEYFGAVDRCRGAAA